jgi:hypothetical protein
MQYSWEEIDQLATILEAEAAGRDVDVERARQLAGQLARTCPDIAATMTRIINRMSVGPGNTVN